MQMFIEVVEPTEELSSDYLSRSVHLNSRVNLNNRKSATGGQKQKKNNPERREE